MSIRFRKDRQKYELSIFIEGKRKRLLFDTKREALDQQFSGNSGDEKSITIEHAIQTYFANVSSGKSSTSMKNERRYFNLMFHFLTVEKGLSALSQVRYGHMVALQTWLGVAREYDGKKMSWAPPTVNRAFNSIKDFFVYWVREGELLASPCEHLSHLQHEDRSRRPMTAQEFQLAFEAADAWFKPVMLFIHATGSAPSSVERLKWSDVDFGARKLVITRRKGAKGKWRRITHPLTHELEAILTAQTRHHEHVFSNEGNEPLTASWCSKVGNRAIKKAGLEGVVLYCARHGLASDLTDANVNLEIVRELLGHANIRTTQRYAKASTDSLERALRLVRGSNLPPNCHQLIKVGG